MCGITGYCGEEIRSRVLVRRLAGQLQRGQSGFGLARARPVGLSLWHSLHLEELPLDVRLETAIAHNRLPSTGEVSVANCHPFLACDGQVAVVHNGHIAGWEVQRAKLQQAGHHFTSTVDSEVLAHTLEDLPELTPATVLDCLLKVGGQATIAVLDSRRPWQLLLARGSGAPVFHVTGQRGASFASESAVLANSGPEFGTAVAELPPWTAVTLAGAGVWEQATVIPPVWTHWEPEWRKTSRQDLALNVRPLHRSNNPLAPNSPLAAWAAATRDWFWEDGVLHRG